MHSTIPNKVRLLIPLIGSPIDGEVLSTCRAIVRTLAANGLSVHDLVAAIPSEAAAVPAYSFQREPSFFDMARACRDLDCGRLNAAEKRFVGEMVRLGRGSPSSRQAAWLSSIFAKLDRRAAA